MFLRRVAAHAVLRTSADLQTFLEAKVWELQTVKNASTRSSWLPSLFSDDRPSPLSLVSATLGVSNRPPDEVAIEKLRKYAHRYTPSRSRGTTWRAASALHAPTYAWSHCARYASSLSAVKSKHEASVATLGEIATEFSQLGPSFDLLSQCESELSAPYSEMASSLEALSQIHLDHVQV